jgi:hypothetical protein
MRDGTPNADRSPIAMHARTAFEMRFRVATLIQRSPLMPRTLKLLTIGISGLLAVSTALAVPKPPKPSPPKPPKPPNSAINHLHQHNAAAAASPAGGGGGATAEQRGEQCVKAATRAATQAAGDQDYRASNNERQLLLKELENGSRRSRERRAVRCGGMFQPVDPRRRAREAPITRFRPGIFAVAGRNAPLH